MDINYDLEKYPLQIRTDSVVGSDEKLKVRFKRADGEFAGEVTINLRSPPQYAIDHCYTSWTNLPTALPTESDRTWKLTLTRTSVARLVIHCNNVEVLNVEISAGTCVNHEWSTFWSKKVQKIYFHPNDGASDYYKPGK